MRRALLWALALAAVAAFGGLGRWQWQRAQDKAALLAQRASVLAAAPQSLSTAAADPEGLVWAEGEGVFLDRPAVLLDNQQQQGRVGVRVYRAFQPADPSPPMLIDLGWLPLPADRRLPATPAIVGPQRLRGLASAPPSPGLAVGEAVQPQADGRLLVTRLDPSRLAAALGLAELAPRVLRLDPALPLGYARDLELLPNTLPPEKHRGYAVQWWSLAAAVAVLSLWLGLRRRHP